MSAPLTSLDHPNSYIGRSVPRLEDEPLLRGKGRFVDDLHMPGMLEAAFVRSPHAHALVRSIRKDAALARKALSVHSLLRRKRTMAQPAAEQAA